MTVWTVLAIKTNNFAKNDKGFVTGFGFLIIFSISFNFGQKIISIKKFLNLSISIVLLYSFSSFILSSWIFGLVDSYFIYAIFNSIFVSLALTLILNRLYTIELKKQTFIYSTIFILTSYLINEIYSKNVYPNYNLHPAITIFIFFQSFAIIPLLLGLTLKKKACI